MADEKEEDRTLTDADIDALLDRASQRFCLNVGTGVLGLVWKAVLLGLVLLAAYGATHSR